MPLLRLFACSPGARRNRACLPGRHRVWGRHRGRQQPPGFTPME